MRQKVKRILDRLDAEERRCERVAARYRRLGFVAKGQCDGVVEIGRLDALRILARLERN